ncbi:hypothetical protein [Streptomyces sp. NPDC058394]|uniref:hypothetical protein n=1 Tax=Streptomyces sp. NPDC058394 TaxID=3346477 RepID=UPI00365829D9
MSLRSKTEARLQARPEAAAQAPDAYDGTTPFPLSEAVPPRSPAQRWQLAVTALIVLFPFLTLMLAAGDCEDG